MKSYLSSVLKSVLTVLIAVLIPVLMLAGCEKAPEEQQTIEDFLASDEAAQQVEFIASIVCSQTADGFNGIVGSGTLWDFVFSDIESIRSLGTVRTEEGFDYLYLPRAEGERLLYKYFGVTDVSTDCDFYDSETDCFVFSDAFDRFPWNIHSAEIYSSDDKTVTYKLVFCYPICDETPCEYMSSLLTLNIIPDGDSYHLQAKSCIASDVEYSTIEEAKAASVSASAVTPALSAEEAAEIAQKYLWPLQPISSLSFFDPHYIDDYSLVRAGVWAGLDVNFYSADINSFYGRPSSIKKRTDKTFSVQPVNNALLKYFGLSEEYLAEKLRYQLADSENYYAQELSYDDEYVIMPTSMEQTGAKAKITYRVVPADMKKGEDIVAFYARHLADWATYKHYVATLVFDENGGWNYASLLPLSVENEGRPLELAEKYLKEELDETLSESRKSFSRVFGEYGVTAAAENISVMDASIFTCDIVLSGSGGSFAFPIRAAYEIALYDNSVRAYVDYFFAVQPFGESTLCLMNGKTAVLLDTETMTGTDISEKISAAAGDGFLTVCSAKDEKNYYFICTNFSENKIITLDENFAKVNEAFVYNHLIYSSSRKFVNNPNYQSGVTLVNIFGGTKLKLWSDLYDVSTGDSYDYYEICSSFGSVPKEEENGAAILCVLLNDSETPDRYLAAIYEKGEIVESFEFDCGEIRTSFESESGETVKFDEKKRILHAVDPEVPEYTLTADFNAKTVTCGFSEIPESLLEEHLDTSADGKYSLYYGAYYGGGDIIYASVFLKNNQTGEIKYFGNFGGMYGGFSFIGFLKNDEIYFMTAGSLKIYNPDTLEVTFDLAENFWLGIDESIDTCRLLYTFRRDPVNMDFIVIYSETPYSTINWGNYDDVPANFTYRVGFLDRDGKLLESYDTGKPVRSTFFGIDGVDLSLKGDSLQLYFYGGKGSTDASGTFDLKTHEYKDD